MTSTGSIGRGATCVGLALFLWHGAPTSAGDAVDAQAGGTAGLLRNAGHPGSLAWDVRSAALPRLQYSWAWADEPSPFVQKHLLPRLDKVMRGMQRLPSGNPNKQLEAFRLRVERATEEVAKDFLEDNALEPIRAKLVDALERTISRRSSSRESRPGRPASVSSASRPGPSEAARRPARKSSRRAKVDFDLGYAGGSPEVTAKYEVRRVNLELELADDSPELRLRYKAGGMNLDFGLDDDSARLRLNYRSGQKSLRFDLGSRGRIGIEYGRSRSSSRSRIKADLDTERGTYSVSYVRRP